MSHVREIQDSANQLAAGTNANCDSVAAFAERMAGKSSTVIVSRFSSN
jgi:hypothetical protein